MPSPRILVVGSSNTDMVVRVAHIPRPGETILGRDFLITAGGKGANQAVAAAEAGGHVTFVARIGRDANGDHALAGFVRRGIEPKYIQRDRKEPSGVALIFVAGDGENSIAVAPGANARLSIADIRKAAPAFRATKILVTQLESPLPTVRSAIDLAASLQIPVILNPAPARPLPHSLLKNVSVLTPNETEAEMLTGIKVRSLASAGKAADVLLKRGVGAVIITLGARGAFLATPDEKRLIPTFKTKVVDTTAAGDTFNGALAVALGEGQPLADAVLFANAAAAISVSRLGAQTSTPSRREILALLGSKRKTGL